MKNTKVFLATIIGVAFAAWASLAHADSCQRVTELSTQAVKEGLAGIFGMDLEGEMKIAAAYLQEAGQVAGACRKTPPVKTYPGPYGNLVWALQAIGLPQVPIKESGEALKTDLKKLRERGKIKEKFEQQRSEKEQPSLDPGERFKLEKAAVQK